MVGAETPCPRTPGNQSRRFPPSDKPTGAPSATGGLGVSAPHVFRHVIYCVRINPLERSSD
jgi:hypothetical protein